MYPRVSIDLEHLRENVKTVKGLCDQHGIQITGVTKVYCGDPKIAEAYLDGGLTMLGDSRVSNLKRLNNLPAEKWLIRPPMRSEAEDTARYADAALHSEWEVIRAVADAAHRQGRRHKVILMADLGDIREGYVDYDELLDVAARVEKLPGAELYGVGVNLTCFSFIQSDSEKLGLLADLARRAGEAAGHPLSIVSGGNSATIDLMLRNGIPQGVNHLRLGESLLFGKERAKYQYLPGTHRDVFTLECEIVELKDKPSLPWGVVGTDSYGKKPTFVDRGSCRRKAVCALGKQDFDLETTTPVDPGIIPLGASSDHLMLDVTDSQQEYKVGDIVRLQLGYFSTMRAFTSQYVEKVYLNG